MILCSLKISCIGYIHYLPPSILYVIYRVPYPRSQEIYIPVASKIATRNVTLLVRNATTEANTVKPV